MKLETKNLHERRSVRSKAAVDFSMEKLPPEPPMPTEPPLQDLYMLEGRVRYKFWANAAQLKRAKREAHKALHAHLFADMLPIVSDLMASAPDEETYEMAGLLKRMMTDPEFTEGE